MLLDFINSNQSLLETLIIVGLITAVVGVVLVMFWQYIIFGLLGLFCVVVLANHKSPEKPKEEIIVKRKVLDNEKIRELTERLNREHKTMNKDQ